MPEPTTITPAAPTPGSPEADAAAAALYEKRTAEAAGTPPATTPAEKPEGVPDKFWNAEKGQVNYADWAKSTAELEKRLSQSPKPADPPVTPPATETPPADPAAAAALADKGLKFDEFTAEFAETGELSEASYEKLNNAGLDKGLVDAYIAGQKALAASYDATAFEVVGGQENYSKEVLWAKANLPQAEQLAFNKAVSSGDPATMRLAVSGLHQSYLKANGSDPALLGGNNTAPPPSGYRSRAEQSAAINKKDDRGRKLYDIDPAYRAEVTAKMASAQFIT